MEVVVVDKLGKTAAAATVVIVLDTDIDDVILGEALSVMLLPVLFIPTPPPPLCEWGIEDVAEGEAPFERDDVGDAVTVIELVDVLEKEAVRDELDVTVPEADVVADGVREDEDVIDIVTLSV